jgi:hypothetical protein
MTDSIICGSLVLSATTPIQEFPSLVDANTVRGFHTEGRFKGAYSLLVEGDYEEVEVPLPTRNKYLTVTALSEYQEFTEAITNFCYTKLQEIDSLFEGARHLFKMQRMMDSINELHVRPQPYIVCINNNSNHSYFTLLVSGMSLHVYGVYDTVNKSVRLVWTNDEAFISSCRAVDPTRYVFYRYPPLNDRPMFIYTQAICAKWSEWSRVFSGPDGVLKSFNALENFLYKDPNTASFTPQPQS